MRERDHLVVNFERVSHSDGVRVARDRQDISGGEDIALLEQLGAHLTQGQAVGRWVKLFAAPRMLDGLKGDAAHAGLLEPILNDLTELVIVDALFHGHHQGD